jgi:hypothetical protein
LNLRPLGPEPSAIVNFTEEFTRFRSGLATVAATRMPTFRADPLQASISCQAQVKREDRRGRDERHAEQRFGIVRRATASARSDMSPIASTTRSASCIAVGHSYRGRCGPDTVKTRAAFAPGCSPVGCFCRIRLRFPRSFERFYDADGLASLVRTSVPGLISPVPCTATVSPACRSPNLDQRP